MLNPLPIAFNEERHEYTWEPTGEQMLWSISGVVKPLSPEQREWLQANSHYAERGTAIHLSLEQFLRGQRGMVFTDLESTPIGLITCCITAGGMTSRFWP